LVNDAPTTVAAKVAATANDFTNDVCRKFQRRMPQETPQRPTMNAAGFHDVCRRNAAAAPHRKTAPKNSPGKDRLLGVGSLGSRRVVENFPARRAVGRHWPSQVAYALWRRAAHRDRPPHDRPPVQSLFHLAAAAAPGGCLASARSLFRA